MFLRSSSPPLSVAHPRQRSLCSYLHHRALIFITELAGVTLLELSEIFATVPFLQQFEQMHQAKNSKACSGQTCSWWQLCSEMEEKPQADHSRTAGAHPATCCSHCRAGFRDPTQLPWVLMAFGAMGPMRDSLDALFGLVDMALCNWRRAVVAAYWGALVGQTGLLLCRVEVRWRAAFIKFSEIWKQQWGFKN